MRQVVPSQALGRLNLVVEIGTFIVCRNVFLCLSGRNALAELVGVLISSFLFYRMMLIPKMADGKMPVHSSAVHFCNAGLCMDKPVLKPGL